MDLSIIIVNWNSAAFAVECIRSVRASVHTLTYEIIVVDNASTDDSVSVLKSQPGVRIISTPVNLGFARANNLGFQYSSGEITLFLNPDTKILGNAVNLTYEALLETPSAGVVGCKLLNGDQSIQTSCIQTFPTILNQLADLESFRLRFPHLRIFGIWPLYDEQVRQITPVEAVSGAYLMIRREVFKQVGMFSTNYFMYAEDLELCYSVRRAGWEVCFVSDGTVIHYGGQSSKQKKDNGFSEVLTRQAIYQFLLKTHGSGYALRYRIAMSIAAVIRIASIAIVASLSSRFVRRERYAAVMRKWNKILRWSLGMESWSARIGATEREKAHVGGAEL